MAHDKKYVELIPHFDRLFLKYGSTPKGVDWPKDDDVVKRLDVLIAGSGFDPQKKPSILDLGCGYGAMLAYLKERHPTDVYNYLGVDLSFPMIEKAKEQFGNEYFRNQDILDIRLNESSFDHVILNGVLTLKQHISFSEMESFAMVLIKESFRVCSKSIAFNVMNDHVDWKRDDLFHWPFDRMAKFIKEHCSRHYSIRADYGLYEYSVFVFKEPNSK